METGSEISTPSYPSAAYPELQPHAEQSLGTPGKVPDYTHGTQVRGKGRGAQNTQSLGGRRGTPFPLPQESACWGLEPPGPTALALEARKEQRNKLG